MPRFLHVLLGEDVDAERNLLQVLRDLARRDDDFRKAAGCGGVATRRVIGEARPLGSAATGQRRGNGKPDARALPPADAIIHGSPVFVTSARMDYPSRLHAIGRFAHLRAIDVR